MHTFKKKGRKEIRNVMQAVGKKKEEGRKLHKQHTGAIIFSFAQKADWESVNRRFAYKLDA